MSKSINLINTIFRRSISISTPCQGKRNFRKFMLINKRGTRLHKLRQASKNPELPIDHRGVRPTGYELNEKYYLVPEMIPELIVPDLKDCKFKPYVSYKATEVSQSKFTSQQLFDAVYTKKIVDDFKTGKLDANGQPIEPSEDEKLQPQEAVKRARKTGTDIF